MSRSLSYLKYLQVCIEFISVSFFLFSWSPSHLLFFSTLCFYDIRRISIPWWPWMEKQSFKWYHSKLPRLDSSVIWALKLVKECRYCSSIFLLLMYCDIVFYGAWFHYIISFNFFPCITIWCNCGNLQLHGLPMIWCKNISLMWCQ